MSGQIPPWQDVLKRYATPRVLRTKAMGTPFQVRAEGGELVVRTSSGSDRPVPWREFRECWPFIASGAARGQWKHLSNNTSYLDAIHDDLAEVSDPTAAVPLAAQSHPLEIGLLREEVQDLKTALDHERRRRQEAEDRFSDASSLSAAVTAQLDAANTRLSDLQALTVRLKSDLDRASTEQARRADPRSQPTDDEARIKLEEDVAELQRKLFELKRRKATETASQTAEIERLRAELQRLSRLETETATSLNVTIDIGSKTFGSVHKTVPEVASLLKRAASLVFSHPDGAVLDTRRALEAIGYCLIGEPRERRRFGEVLDLLRGDPNVPPPDWHLFKNLYSRASAIVHEGGATAEAALWIWLGAKQLSELVGSLRDR